MKTVILAGGFGTRISEETHLRPKPLIEIGDMPILWHIMQIYTAYGFHDFIVCLGYKGQMIKEFFSKYYMYQSDITIHFSKGNEIVIHPRSVEPWKVTLVDTGRNSMTGGRVKRIQPYVGDETFMLTYGDGLSNVNISELVAFHRGHGKLATVTSVQPAGRFGALSIADDHRVSHFEEKPRGDRGWVNGGFFVMEPQVFDYIAGDETIFENEPLRNLAADGQLMAYRHSGFWKPMDTLRDKRELEEIWNAGRAPWLVGQKN